MLQAIKIAGQTAGNAVVEEAMDDVYNSVKAGGSIAKPLQENDAFPAMVSHMVAVGEDSGQLETMLEKVADFYETEVDAKVKALTSLIEPMMICSSVAASGSSSSRCTCRSSRSTTTSASANPARRRPASSAFRLHNDSPEPKGIPVSSVNS